MPSPSIDQYRIAWENNLSKRVAGMWLGVPVWKVAQQYRKFAKEDKKRACPKHTTGGVLYLDHGESGDSGGDSGRLLASQLSDPAMNGRTNRMPVSPKDPLPPNVAPLHHSPAHHLYVCACPRCSKECRSYTVEMVCDGVEGCGEIFRVVWP